MKVIEMLVKGIKAVPMHKAEEWKGRYYLTIEGDKIVKKYIHDEREDYLYNYIDVDWLMDEGVEFREHNKRYFVSYKGALFDVDNDKAQRILDCGRVYCHLLKCNQDCVSCPIGCIQDHELVLDGHHVKLHTIEY